MEEKYFAQALAWSIRSDFEFVAWLLDNASFPQDAIRNSAVKLLYSGAVKAYAKAAPRGVVPALDDVILEVSNISSNDIAERWAYKISSMDKPSLLEARSVARTMLEKYTKRVVIESVDTWLQRVESGEIDNGQVYAEFSRLSDNVTNRLIGDREAGRPGDILESTWSSGHFEPQSTGYPRLDIGIDGGFGIGKVYVLGMPSGQGKTALTCNLTSRRVEAGLPSLICSFEMMAEDMLFRMICDLAEVPINVAENPKAARDEEEYNRVMLAKEMLDASVRIYDTDANAAEIDRRIRRHRVEFGMQPILTAIDHLGIIKSGNQDPWRELESMAYDLSSMAKKNNSPILANSQVPFEMEKELQTKNKIVYHRDFRGSRGVRNAVDYAIVGCRHNGMIENEYGDLEYDHSYMNHTALQVIKNRRTGREWWGLFEYDPVHFRMLPTRNPMTKEDVYEYS